LSYAPRWRSGLYPRLSCIIRGVGRFAMPALFAVLTAAFGVIAWASADHGRWVIALAAAAIGAWTASFAWVALRRARR